MSPLLITCCVLFLAAFCVLAYVIEHWSFWKSTGPRRWGWIQSWSKGWNSFIDSHDPGKARAASSDEWRKGWEKFMANLEEETKKARADRIAAAEALKNSSIGNYKAFPLYQAKVLYNDGWRCGGGIDQSGRRILFRGESHAYVSLEVWTEVERLTKAKWDELHGRGSTLHKPGDATNWAVGVDPKRENILFKDGTLHIPEGSSVIDWSKFSLNRKEPRERTQVTEVNEIPDTFDHSDDAAAYAAYGIKNLITFDTGEGESETVVIRYRNKGGRKFLPSVNPLGDTGAFSNWNGSISLERGYSFRHKKGGNNG